MPHITDELYSTLFTSEYEAKGSVHGREQWPDANDFENHSTSETLGSACVELLEAIRKAKSEAAVSIKYPVSHLSIANANYQHDINSLESTLSDLKAAGTVEHVELVDSLDDGTETEAGNFKVVVQLAEQAASAAS